MGKKKTSTVISASAFSFLVSRISLFNLLSTKLTNSNSFLTFVTKHGHVTQIKKNTVRQNQFLIHATTQMELEDMLIEIN